MQNDRCGAVCLVHKQLAPFCPEGKPTKTNTQNTKTHTQYNQKNDPSFGLRFLLFLCCAALFACCLVEFSFLSQKQRPSAASAVGGKRRFDALRENPSSTSKLHTRKTEQKTKTNHNWDLVDSASSHMLVSRTKPCMPQNHCIAGICAWLITSDVICRNYFAVLAILDTLAKRQANT